MDGVKEKLSCAVITPDRQVLDIKTASVVMPAHDGLIGILPGRAPLLCKLGIGIARLGTGEQERKLFIDGGFAEVHDNMITILTSDALEPDQIDRVKEEAALTAARDMPITDEKSHKTRVDAVARAKTKLDLLS